MLKFTTLGTLTPLGSLILSISCSKLCTYGNLNIVAASISFPMSRFYVQSLSEFKKRCGWLPCCDEHEVERSAFLHQNRASTSGCGSIESFVSVPPARRLWHIEPSSFYLHNFKVSCSATTQSDNGIYHFVFRADTSISISSTSLAC